MGSQRGLTVGPRWGFILAAAFYAIWAGVLFFPYAERLSSSFRLLYAIHPAVGALGLFALSRRWLAGWTPAALAGLLYGFGPFGLSFLQHHPVNGILFAAVPWLLLPAVYWQRGQQPTAWRFSVRAGLCALPFAFIIVFFWVFSQHWIGKAYFLPRLSMLSVYDFSGLILPLSMTARPVVLGLYHTGTLAALMGLFVYLSVQRVTVILPAGIGLVLAFLDPVLRVSPAVWAVFPMIFIAILAGLGIQALLWAGKADSKWILVCALGGAILACFCLVLYLPDRPAVYQFCALFYVAGTCVLGVIFLLGRLGLRWPPLRWLLLAGVIVADCFWGARWFIDKLI